MGALSILTLLLAFCVTLVLTVRSVPDPYWRARAFEGIKLERVIPVPVDFVPDPNPEAVPIPAGAPTVEFGLVITNADGYEQIGFNTLHHQGLRTFQMQANKMGKLVLNGTVHYVDLKVLSGGPACSSFLIEYEYLITVVGVQFLFMPVNPDCTQLAFLAEAYEIPIINAPDFALAIYQQIPSLPFASLKHTYSVAANYSLLAPSCLIPVIAAGAKTIAIVHAGTIGQDAVPAVEAAILSLGLTKAMNNTYLDNNELRTASSVGDGCSYVNPIIEQLKIAKPDILYYSLGDIYTDQGILCMHKKGYYPPAFWPFASSTVQNGPNAWQTSYSVINDMWLGGTNATDPLLVSVSDFTTYWTRLWGISQINLISYSATSSTAGTIAIEAINLAGTTDADAFNQAMHTIRFSSVIGDIYLVQGTQVFNHPFFCRQQGNGPTVNETFVIFPDTPSTVPVVYPANTLISIPPSFLESLRSRSWWTTGRKVGVGLGISFGVIIIVGGIAVAFYLLKFKYYAIFIPKGGAKEADHW